MSKALIVDDDPAFTATLAEYLKRKAIESDVVHSLSQARDRCRSDPPDFLLLDLMLPDGNGLDLLGDPGLERTRVLIITDHPSVESAVKALRAGVSDFLIKPLEFERLDPYLDDLGQAEVASACAQNDSASASSSLLVGDSAIMRQTLQEIEKVAQTEATVMIEGETGTGKELAARTIHHLSARRAGPFLAMNCGALPPELIGSELFGHERGSFTGATRRHAGYLERAKGGTLLLDEITEMPMERQAHLLRVLESGSFVRVGGEAETTVKARIIAATNYAPELAVARGSFRQDLYFRLMVFPIRVPPLRARPDDIQRLAQHFLDLLNRQEDTATRLSTEALEALRNHAWPGNVRELRNAMQRAFILAEDSLIQARHLTPYLESAMGLQAEGLTLHPGMTLADAEKRLIEATLSHYKDNKRATAETLGVSLKTLYNRLNQYRHEARITAAAKPPLSNPDELHARRA